MTSALSAKAMSRVCSRTGAGRKPPSLPICQNGSAEAAGLAVGSPLTILRIRNRESEPLRKRKR